jgi:hypothetical protein
LAAAAQDGQTAGTGLKTSRILICFSTVLSVMSGIVAILGAGVGGGCTAWQADNRVRHEATYGRGAGVRPATIGDKHQASTSLNTAHA